MQQDFQPVSTNGFRKCMLLPSTVSLTHVVLADMPLDISLRTLLQRSGAGTLTIGGANMLWERFP